MQHPKVVLAKPLTSIRLVFTKQLSRLGNICKGSFTLAFFVSDSNTLVYLPWLPWAAQIGLFLFTACRCRQRYRSKFCQCKHSLTQELKLDTGVFVLAIDSIAVRNRKRRKINKLLNQSTVFI